MAGRPPGLDEFVFSHSQDKTGCPHCGRYVGPLEWCPYCRKRHNKRLLTRILKYTTPVLAFIGLFMLQQLGQSIGNPQVKLDQLNRKSNFAYVQLEGTVCETPRFYLSVGAQDPTSGSLEFCLDDGTGRTRVKTYEDATRRILEAGKLPAMGDIAHVMGNYNVRTHRNSLIVGAPEEISVSRPPPSAEVKSATLAWASRDDFTDLQRVKVTGWVSFTNIKRGPKSFNAFVALWGGTRKDSKGKKRYARIVFPWTVLEMEGVLKRTDEAWEGAPRKGMKVAVTGALRWEGKGSYAGWKLYPATTSDIQVLEVKDE